MFNRILIFTSLGLFASCFSFADSTSNLNGYFDVVNLEHGLIEGWAIDEDEIDKPAEVQIWISDESGKLPAIDLGMVKAKNYREDLKAIGSKTGNYAFAMKIPDKYRDGKTYYIYAMVRKNSDKDILKQLSKSPKKVTLGAAQKSRK